MKIENEWLEHETMALCNERKIKHRHKTQDTIIMLKMLCMLLAIFFYAVPVNATQPVNLCKNADGGGKLFRCNKCQTNQWCGSNTKDWAGNYYCPACKSKLN